MGNSARKTTYFVSATKTATKLAALMLAVFFASPLDARQNTATLSFHKTIGRERGYTHTVQKGETLLAILKKISVKNPVSLSTIRRLNPKIKNINQIYPGQKIVIALPDNKNPPGTAPYPPNDVKENTTSWRISQNDSISNILLFKLKLSPSEAINAYRRIKALNPEIEDLNQLSAGGFLLLPSDLLKTEEMESSRNVAQNMALQDENKKAVPANASSGLGRLIFAIRPVVEKLKGTINDTGEYYIPLPGKSQVTIHSRLIPSVELDDGTTVFLDYDNRLKGDVKQVIRQHWGNNHFLTGPELQSVDAALQGIIRASSHYKITHVEKPIILSSNPSITVVPDWIISDGGKKQGAPYRQAVFLLGENEAPFPESARSFLENNGLPAVFVSEGKPLSVSLGKAPRIQTQWIDLKGVRGGAFIERLLEALGETFQRNVPVDVFKQAVSGFNLSITADLLIPIGQRKLIIHSRKLPGQFVDILTDEGFELLLIDQSGGGVAFAEQVLRGAGLPVSRGYFWGRYPEEGGKSRLEISFSAVSGASSKGPFYLVDFDMPDWFLPMVKNVGNAVVIRCQ